MSKATETYGNQTIVALKGADRVRMRPAVIFGSDGLEGCEHSIFEILSNSVDEAREGYGDTIIVTAFLDHSIEIEDAGRGVPLDYNENEKRYNWDLIYCELYAGGKYNNNKQSAAYKRFPLGFNGLGACSTQYSSEYMNVVSYNNGKIYEINFKKGKVTGDLKITDQSKRDRRTGTVTRWRPDLDVFTDINVPLEFYAEVLKRQSVVNAGLTFKLRWQTDEGFDEYTYLYPNGIVDYISEIAGDSSITAPVYWETEAIGRDRADLEDYRVRVEFSFCISNATRVIEYYHNSSFLEHGGSPDRAVRYAFTSEIDKYLRNNGKYNKNEAKVTFADIQESLIIVSNTFSTLASYANQTKKSISNPFVYETMAAFLKQKLEVYFAENKLEAEKLAAQIIINKRSRETSEQTRLDTKTKLSGTIDIANRVEKFVNCRSKDPQVRELYIVEGDSALTSCKLGRDSDFQAIIPVRGKTLNCQKNSYDRIFKSEIITDLLKVVGCGVELNEKIKSNITRFNLSDLRWSKIIICTDADKDGYQIRALILTMFYRLLPTLISEGKIFIAESPLYELTCDGVISFAYNESEKSRIIAGYGDKKYTLQRSKGLGENEADMMWQTTMNPATRRLICVTKADAAETERIFDTLLGNNLSARKEFIALYGAKYASDIDLDDE